MFNSNILVDERVDLKRSKVHNDKLYTTHPPHLHARAHIQREKRQETK